MHVGKTFAPINESKKYFKNSVLTSAITSSYIRQLKVIAVACVFFGGGVFWDSFIYNSKLSQSFLSLFRAFLNILLFPKVKELSIFFY